MLSPKEEIKNKLDIVDVLSQYMKLDKVGANYRGLCPFHNDHHPSLYVSPSRQIWKCFVCGAGGDIFTFVMKIENIDFPAALKLLAAKAGVKLRPVNPQLHSRKETLFQINESATIFFQEQLKKNKLVKDYLVKRGLEDKTINDFRLGWAPDEWRSLSQWLLNKGVSPRAIVASGLAITKTSALNLKNPKYKIQHSDIYDRFRGRIMFPIEDSLGRVCAFTGRIFAPKNSLKTVKDINEVGKYVNSPQTLIFDKGQILFGLSRSKNYLRSAGKTLLVEGQMDFLTAWQAGIHNIVATSGTALTSTHLKILKRYNNILILGFDMDEAGQKAAERSIDLALNQEENVKILSLPEGKDLADYLLQENHRQNIQSVIDQAQPVMEFYFQRAIQRGDVETITGKKKIASYFMPHIKQLGNALDRSYWIEKLATYLKMPAQSLVDELNNTALTNNHYFSSTKEDEESAEKKPSVKSDVIADRILSFLIKFPSLKDSLSAYGEYFPQEKIPLLNFVKAITKPDDLNTESLKKQGKDEKFINKISQLILQGDYEAELLDKYQVAVEEQFQKELKNLKDIVIRNQITDLTMAIDQAEKEKDETLVTKLAKRINQLSKKIINHDQSKEKKNNKKTIS